MKRTISVLAWIAIAIMARGVIVQWIVSVGFSYLLGIHWGYGLIGMWISFALDENIRGIIFIYRWRSLKWASKGFVNSVDELTSCFFS